MNEQEDNGTEPTKPKAILLTTEQLMSAAESDDYMGFCLACGKEAYGVEPDARRYQCEVCGAYKVYGAEELLMMGAYK